MPKPVMLLRQAWKAEEAVCWVQDALAIVSATDYICSAREVATARRRYAKALKVARELLAKLPDTLPDDLG